VKAGVFSEQGVDRLPDFRFTSTEPDRTGGKVIGRFCGTRAVGMNPELLLAVDAGGHKEAEQEGKSSKDHEVIKARNSRFQIRNEESFWPLAPDLWPLNSSNQLRSDGID
jgi:hypothetical protein